VSDRDRWQQRHAGRPPRAAPSAFVQAQVTQLERDGRRGRALDLACGAGRHAALLAESGFETIAVDHASQACRRVAGDAPQVRAVVADAGRLPFRAATFDVIVQTLFLDRSLFPALLALLTRGGLLLAETFLLAQHEQTGHPRREFCLAPGELHALVTRTGEAVRVVAEREGPVASGESILHLASIAVCKV
jgi:SAM-dependent methyltransferase